MLAVLSLTAVAALSAVQVLGIAVVWRRLGRAPDRADIRDMPAITLLRPVCGLENNLDETLRSTFALEARDYEILFCAARADDPAVPLIERLIAAYPGVTARILVGDDRPTGNPKLDNLLKGWAAARHDWIVMADSNLLLPPDYLRQLVALWTPGTGLVSSPATGAAPEGMAARIEAGFLNGYQARWQLFADEISQGYAQGKTLFWRRDILDAAGGPAALGRELAEDVAATKLVRSQGLKVRVARAAFAQPLGRRSFPEIWRRQVRWARVRRVGFPALYVGEILSGAFLPTLLVAGLASAGVLSWVALPALLVVWYGLELALASRAGWPARPQDLFAALLRDLMIPAVWVAGWAGSGFTWRGTVLSAQSGDGGHEGVPG
jgi:ceramide glucosyltransferase